MAFRYINPGYAELLNGSGATTVENSTYNPQNGISFSAYSQIIHILPAGKVTRDFFCKFNLYLEGNSHSKFYLGLLRKSALTSSSWMAGIRVDSSKIGLYCSSTSIGSSINLKSNALNEILFAIHLSDTTAATCELTVNDNETVSGDFTNSNSYDENSPIAVSFPSNSYGTFHLSELILSDEEILPREKITVLPISTTATDMADSENGIYIANAANQTLLQTPNVSSLITNYGANSAITGISVAGKTAYRTGTGITKLIGLSKSGNVVTEHGTCILSEDSSAAVADAWSVNNMTISDLQNMQFGWKAGE